jgi:tight adherence protein C
MMLFAPAALRERLGKFMGKSGSSESTALEKRGWMEHVAKLVRPLTKLSVPEEGWEKSALRISFMNAGWRNPSAPTLYFASKTALALLAPAIVGLVLALTTTSIPNGKILFMLLLTATLGYYMPNVLLKRIVGASSRSSKTSRTRSTC